MNISSSAHSYCIWQLILTTTTTTSHLTNFSIVRELQLSSTILFCNLQKYGAGCIIWRHIWRSSAEWKWEEIWERFDLSTTRSNIHSKQCYTVVNLCSSDESTFSSVHPFSIFDSTVNRVHSKGTTYDVDLVLGASLAIFLTICNNSVILTTLSYHVGHFHCFHKT